MSDVSEKLNMDIEHLSISQMALIYIRTRKNSIRLVQPTTRYLSNTSGLSLTLVY